MRNLEQPEAALWRAVVVRTLRDLVSGSPAQAIDAGYCIRDPWFEQVCDGAGIDVAMVRTASRNKSAIRAAIKALKKEAVS